MSQKSFDWTAKTEQAALLVAEDDLTDDEIAARVSVTRRTLERWKKNDDFRQRVRSHIAEFAASLQRYHIARKDKRVAAMDARWHALQQVIEERARDTRMPSVPGVSTGHIIRTFKGKDADVEEFVIDTGLLAELRALEKQAAQEAGQWADRTEVTGKDGDAVKVAVTHEHDFDFDAFRALFTATINGAGGQSADGDSTP